METITKQQFDNLKVGDELKNNEYTLLIEAKFPNTIMTIYDEYNSCIFSLKGLQNSKYSITQPIQHLCGFPYGDYSDREVVIKVSDKDMEYCNNKNQYTRLMSVSEKGFQDHNGDKWKFAVLISNNVDLVK
jgi:hypothetical protein